jgi:hypothetical protein
MMNPPEMTEATEATESADHYQISRQGAAWSSVRYGTLADEIARVERILAGERERISGINRFDGWIERDACGGSVQKVAIRIDRWDYATRTATPVARWLGGERVL